MGPSFKRVAAGACLLATGLFTGSSAIALAAPGSGEDNGSSNGASHKPVKNTSERANRTRLAGPASRNNQTSNNADATADGDLSNYVGSTKGPSANAVANLPDAAGAAIASVPSAVRDVVSAIKLPTAAPVSSPPRTGIPLVQPPTLAGALAPLMNSVEDVATALLGPQASKPLMSVANQFLDGVSASTPAAATAAHDNKLLPSPVALPAPTMPVQAADLPVPVVPGSSRIVTTTVAPTQTAAPAAVTPGVITPQLLSNRVNVSTSKPVPVAPAATPATPNWFSGIASQIFHGVREAFRNVSVTELALAALPGVAGLIFFFATGVGLGRRQAKFGFAMASSGALRFAVRGPMGVVRNGSTVAVHSRKKAKAAPVGGEERPTRHLRLVDAA